MALAIQNLIRTPSAEWQGFPPGVTKFSFVPAGRARWRPTFATPCLDLIFEHWCLCALECAFGGRRPIMKKLGMLGIIGGAALLTVAPFSLQWPQDEGSLSRANAQKNIAGVHRRVYRTTYRPPAYAPAGGGGGRYR